MYDKLVYKDLLFSSTIYVKNLTIILII